MKNINNQINPNLLNNLKKSESFVSLLNEKLQY